MSSALYCAEYAIEDCIFHNACTRIWCRQPPSFSDASRRITKQLVAANLWYIPYAEHIQVLGLGKFFFFSRISLSPEQRRRIIERDGLVCRICGKQVPEEDVHIDHVRPVLVGGVNIEANLRVTHSRCNLRRSKRPPEFMQ